jgi:hypothetical protein
MILNLGKMCIGRILVILALAAVSISLLTDPAYAITIKGNIINMGEAKEYVAVDSFLQLGSMTKDGGINFKTDDRGRFIFDSNLPQTEIPKTGTFSISAPGLKLGRYIIISQKLKAWGIEKRGGRFLGKVGERKPLEIEIKAGADESTIDIGDVYIPVPNSKHF